MISSTDQPAPHEEEDDRVLDWRFEQLSKLGFDDVHAFVLARSELDLPLIRKLIGLGCPLDFAVKIAL